MTGAEGKPARGILIDWANAQDGWIRAIAGEVISTQTSPSSQSLNAAKEIFYREKRLRGGPAEVVAKIENSDSNQAAPSDLRLSGLRECKNVNKLSEGQEIDFGARLTVLFGENASGKTGYVRILKRASGVRRATPVLPDIGAAGRLTPEARLEYSVDDAPASHHWVDEVGVRPLTRISVFDTPAVPIHLTENLEYIFTPADLSLFQLVHSALTEVRQEIQKEIEQEKPRGNPFLGLFTQGTAVYAAIETLGPSTQLAELDALATFSDGERGEVRDLQVQIDALNPRTSEATIDLIRRRLSALERADELLNEFAQFDYSEYARVRQEVETLEEARAQDASVVGGGVDESAQIEWLAFVDAAESFIQASGRTDYPSGSDSCIYCHQTLSEPARNQVLAYRRYSQADTAGRITTLEGSLATAALPIRRSEPTKAEAAVAGVGDSLGLETEMDATLRRIMIEVKRVKDLDVRAIEASAHDLAEAARTLSPRLKTQISTLTESLQNAQSSNAERESLLSAATARMSEYTDRNALRSTVAEVKEFAGKARWAQQAQTHIARLQGPLKSLTEASKNASEQALQRNFEERFNEEREALRAPRVVLNFPGRQGQTTRSKSVSPVHNLDAVLSEGEQKVIALADFLAEVTLRPGSAPVVFDDPVNSLDYRRLYEVVDRLIKLSESRQVIVFTHNIWFAKELLGRFEFDPERYKYFDVQDLDGAKGIVTAGSGPRTDNLKQTKRQIDDVVAQAKKQSGELQRSLIERGYELLRNWCESFVEHELLNGVTQRYSPHVGVTRIAGLEPDKISAVSSTISELYAKCCRQIRSHSQPLETMNVRASLSDFEADWTAALGCQQQMKS